MKTKNIIGQTFDRLTVIKRDEDRRYFWPNGRLRMTVPYWVCRCVCGTIKKVAGYSLRFGKIRSCGCLWRQRNKLSKNLRHGHTKNRKTTLTYSSWQAMKARCDKPTHKYFSYYGGRGIKYCERWGRFENFVDDIGTRPSRKHSIERRNNDLGYFPENCYWATAIAQGRNKRNSHLITFNEQTLTLTQWAQHLKIDATTLQKRLGRQWSIEKAFTTAVDLRHSPKRWRRR